jgi:hypothetical protein
LPFLFAPVARGILKNDGHVALLFGTAAHSARHHTR